MAERRAFRPVRDRDLSLWQSAAASVARQHRGSALGPAYDHELVQTATAQAVTKSTAPATASQARQSDRAWASRKMAAAPDSAKLSNLAFQYAIARRERRTADADKLENELRKYGDGGTQWITCAEEYLAYYVLADRHPTYREPTGSGFGLISCQLPLNATIALLGDWGTGMDDARQLLYSVLDRHKPDAIIHLGDVYYSGTSSRDGKPGECQTNFIKVIDDAFAKVGKRVPVFAIPGNHDYYSGGSGFFEIIDSINAPRIYAGADASWAQQASFFCLRSADQQWQFLGMDTGVSDRNPMSKVTAPRLRERESEWLQQRIRDFPGTTILLSHHQLFSGNEQLNDKGRKYVNEALLDTFAPYFDKVAAWYWGHEHNFVLFENGLFGLAKGRLLGSSAYEEVTESNPYELKAAAEGIRYLDKDRYRLDSTSGYFNHSYAVLQLRGDSIEASYYQFPSWGDTPPSVAVESLIFKENLSVAPGSAAPEPTASITSGVVVRLETPNGRCIGAAYSGLRYYYPTLGDRTRAIGLEVAKASGGGGTLRHGDQITLRATERGLGDKNVLGAFKDASELYYYSAGYADNETWILRRADGPGELRSGDAVGFTSVRFAGQYLRPAAKTIYLTCEGPSAFFWRATKE